jgi:hypothetical protein
MVILLKTLFFILVKGLVFPNLLVQNVFSRLPLISQNQRSN